jgi:hypothetical protein
LLREQFCFGVSVPGFGAAGFSVFPAAGVCGASVGFAEGVAPGFAVGASVFGAGVSVFGFGASVGFGAGAFEASVFGLSALAFVLNSFIFPFAESIADFPSSRALPAVAFALSHVSVADFLMFPPTLLSTAFLASAAFVPIDSNVPFICCIAPAPASFPNFIVASTAPCICSFAQASLVSYIPKNP